MDDNALRGPTFDEFYRWVEEFDLDAPIGLTNNCAVCPLARCCSAIYGQPWEVSMVAFYPPDEVGDFMLVEEIPFSDWHRVFVERADALFEYEHSITAREVLAILDQMRKEGITE